MAGFNNVCMIFFIIYIGQYIHISNEILLENRVLSSVRQKYISFRNYDRNGVNATWNAVSDVLMWIKTKNRSVQWIQYLGCQVLNVTAEKEANNTYFPVDIGNTSYRIQMCVTNCNTIDKTIANFGLKDSTCHCFKNKLRTSNVTHKCLGGISENRCDSNNTLMLYSKTDETRSAHIIEKREKWVESAMDCTKDIHNLSNTTNQLKEGTFWIVIPRNEQFLMKYGDAESTCIVTTFSNSIVSPVINDCFNMSYYMMCNNTDWTNKSSLSTSSYFCSTKECILYSISIVAGIIGINVLAVLVCNAYRNRKTVRIKERANRTVEEIQLDEMPTASSNLYEEHFDADINQINHAESDEFNNAENEINGSKSRVKIDAIRQNKKTEEQAAAENQYNSLNHTLRKPDDAARNDVYDKVKPAVITLIRGDRFIGTEYDSVDVLKE
ncbi:uncharacterized protein LOC127728090 isoform X2 [Mytilus californianus]|uniref:uncharacterized protein LOC127728090 isoform X2 n=1 Tax=Mytilus californianus TaxID=6549 RepID=UPI002245EE87|nr:uncharacterized protein LOC127728090 isoform X2 [Mytilus californianus]